MVCALKKGCAPLMVKYGELAARQVLALAAFDDAAALYANLLEALDALTDGIRFTE